MSANPWLKTLQLPLANTNYNLLTLMKAVDATVPIRAQYLQIQFDVDGGGARLRIGNDDVSNTNYGILLFATQAHSMWHDANSINLDQYYLRSDTAGLFVTISAGVL